jgi:hypothetical protein
MPGQTTTQTTGKITIKPLLSLILLGCLFWHPALQASDADSKIVFHINDYQKMGILVDSVTSVLEDTQIPAKNISVVFHGSVVTRLHKSSNVKPVLANLNGQGVNLQACGMALRANNLLKDQILSSVNVVPSGVVSVLRLQQQGHIYIKI